MKTKYSTSGMSQTPFYRVWVNMKARCTKPSHTLYKWYGGRGVTMCEKWSAFLSFYDDMHKGYAKGLQLDRIDNEKGYSKDNCRWVTSSANNRNRRSNRIVHTPDGLMVLAKAAEVYGLSPSLITTRLKRGYSVQKTFAKIDYRSAA